MITGKIFISLFILIGLFSSCSRDRKLAPGFPDRSPALDVLPGFRNPPKGYGEVSFYWWVGDSLTKDRIIWQLDQLKDMNISGLQINYCHTDKGGASYGLTYPSQPALFSPEWWELFKWFLNEAQKRGMSVSLSDYTLGAAGQGWYVDEMLDEDPGLHGTKLEAKQWEVSGGSLFRSEVPPQVVTCMAYKINQGELDGDSGLDLNSSINGNELNWLSPVGDWKVILVYRNTIKTSWDPMNPMSGRKVIEKFYQRFEDHCPGEAGKGLNFFFSDELQFGISGFLWNGQFADEFRKRKGYEILPELPGLFADLGPRSYKIRLDYNDVMVSLSEEGFFKPVYEWHYKRGMLFGCDHGGRGRDVTEFGDYFRTQRWMSGPGCDQPGLGRDIVKNKVASSIAHLYERPRTWLEGFYGSGWGTSSQEVADATFVNFAMGQNLLSLHGLYYTTHGSWWEWAAPDNHWRQPYWEHMVDFMKCSERLSYVLSQGVHCCDVAMIYPVAPVVANLNGKKSTETAFTIARDLYPAGIDFDFMDFESLCHCRIEDRELLVSGENYKVLILPAMSAARYSTIEKALEFFRSGGIVLAVGSLPEASDRIGGNDEQLQSMVLEMFGTIYSEKHDSTAVYSRESKSGGKGLFVLDPMAAKKIIRDLIQPDFKVLSGDAVPGILHRKIGNRDLYFVYGLAKGTVCSFRATGKVELWNPWDGSIKPLPVNSVSESGTTIGLPLEKSEPQLIIFSPGNPEIELPDSISVLISDSLVLNHDWEFELVPTLDNKYGDYRLPAFNDKIGVEVWEMKFSEENNRNIPWQQPDFDDSKWQAARISFGQQFWKLGPLPNDADYNGLEFSISKLRQINPDAPVIVKGKKYFWSPYEFSWRWGLKDDAGHQGYHGYKGRVNDELISFGKIDKTGKYMPVYPLFTEREGSVYFLWTTVVSHEKQEVKIEKDGLLPTGVWINGLYQDPVNSPVELDSGNNPILLKYQGIGRGYYLFMDKSAGNGWDKPVSLATGWYLNPSVLPFDCYPEAKGTSGCYRFMAPPGTKKMLLQSPSKPELWINGSKTPCEAGDMVPGMVADTRIPVWQVVFPDSLKYAVQVAMRIMQLPGVYGGAILSEPVIFDCGQGSITLGNLGKSESLRTYSGGMWYLKTINISGQQAASTRIMLDLGELVASAAVLVNGEKAGSKVSPPWTFDLSGKLKPGKNRIEILVYNSLGNHYLNTPSQYIGRINSGLIGPVKLKFSLF